MTIGLGHYLAVSAILFTLGVLGIFVNRKNIITALQSQTAFDGYSIAAQ